MARLHFGVNIASTFHNEAYIENGEHNARTNNALSDLTFDQTVIKSKFNVY